MVVNGLTLPQSLVDALKDGKLRRSVGSWQLLHNLDAFGNPLETELGDVWGTKRRMEKETAELREGFPPEDFDQAVYDEAIAMVGGRAVVPYVLDFSEVVCFAISGDGAPFCLDYRETPDRPRVIWWDDVYWRCVAPDFDAFLALFNWEENA